MIGWVLFACILLVWWRSRHRHIVQRMNLANYIIMLLLDEDVYRKNQQSFREWLREADGSDQARLWLASNTAIENAARNWASKAPTPLGVGQMVWEAKHDAKI